LIVSGAEDRIVWQGAWKEPRFPGSNVMHRAIEGGAHFPWIENPQAVQQAFSELAAKVAARLAK
jgi:pimeloyl-ACP methyl ester carboxylesterase